MECILLTLPPELFCNIIKYIDKSFLYRLCITCKTLSTILTQEYDDLWKSLVHSLLKKPVKYIYNTIHDYNDINHTHYKSWIQLYYHLTYTLEYITQTTWTDVFKSHHLELCRLIHIPQIMLNTQVTIYNTLTIYTAESIDEITINQPIDIACSINSPHILSEVMSYYNIHIDDIINRTLITACNYGSIKCVRHLLTHYCADPSYAHSTSLIVAVFKSSIDVVEELLKYPQVDPSDQDNAAMRVCIFFHSYEKEDNLKQIFKLLLRDERVKNKLIQWDIYHPHKDYLRFLLSNPVQAALSLESTVKNETIKWHFLRILDMLL